MSGVQLWFRKDWSLCGAIVKIAASLRLETIAEGIETAEQRAQLILLGCESGQGFLFHQPKPIDQIRELLEGDGTPKTAQVGVLSG